MKRDPSCLDRAKIALDLFDIKSVIKDDVLVISRDSMCEKTAATDEQGSYDEIRVYLKTLFPDHYVCWFLRDDENMYMEFNVK